MTPLLTAAFASLQFAVSRADEKSTQAADAPSATASVATQAPAVTPVVEKKEQVINSRIYDANVIGEPMALGKDKSRVWEKLMNARVVYLGEAEQVPTHDDKELELEICKNLRKRCLESERPLSVAMEAFPCDLQEQLNQYIDKR